MVFSCSAFGCTHRRTSGVARTFHRFPFPDPERLSKWTSQISDHSAGDGKVCRPTSYSRLCSDHFLPTDYQTNAKTTTLLKTAVPSVFPFQYHPSNDQPATATTTRGLIKGPRKSPRNRPRVDETNGNTDVSSSSSVPSTSILPHHHPSNNQPTVITVKGPRKSHRISLRNRPVVETSEPDVTYSSAVPSTSTSTSSLLTSRPSTNRPSSNSTYSLLTPRPSPTSTYYSLLAPRTSTNQPPTVTIIEEPRTSPVVETSESEVTSSSAVLSHMIYAQSNDHTYQQTRLKKASECEALIRARKLIYEKNNQIRCLNKRVFRKDNMISRLQEELEQLKMLTPKDHRFLNHKFDKNTLNQIANEVRALESLDEEEGSSIRLVNLQALGSLDEESTSIRLVNLRTLESLDEESTSIRLVNLQALV